VYCSAEASQIVLRLRLSFPKDFPKQEAGGHYTERLPLQKAVRNWRESSSSGKDGRRFDQCSLIFRTKVLRWIDLPDFTRVD
jgi:hypothetical protein